MGLGEQFDQELLTELVLSTRVTAVWRFDFADDRTVTTAGMADVLGVNGGEDDVNRMLATLVEPILNGARTALVWEHFQLEQRVDTANGTRWIEFRARRTAGDPGGVLGVATDVTVQREASEALTDLADRYRLLSELSPDGIVVHQAGQVVYANAATIRFLGLRSSLDLLHRSIMDFVHPDSVTGLQQRLAGLTTHGATSEPADAVLLRPDGGTVVVESVSVRTTWEGEPAYQVIMRDLTAKQLAEQSLRYQAALVSHVSDAIIGTDGAGVVTSWNQAAEAVYGHVAAEALGRPVGDVVGAQLDPGAVVRSGGVADHIHHRADGAALDVRVSAAEMGDGYVLMCCDETQRRRAEQLFTNVVAALEEGVAVIGPTGRIEAANPAASHIMGMRSTDHVGDEVDVDFRLWEVYDETGTKLTPAEYPTTVVARTGEPQYGRILRLRQPNGRSVWVSQSCRPLNPDRDGPHSVVISFSDITERRAIDERLRYQATHDPLTGLANRTLLRQRLTETVRDRRRTGITAVLYLDLDKFKVINDSLGHGVGDEVLRVVGARLGNTVRRDGLIGRLGGDEFAVVVGGVEGADAVCTVAERVLATLGEPVTISGHLLHLNASIGIVLITPDDQRSAEELLRDADVAMYQAKSAGRGRYEFFDVELRERMQRRMRLEQDLRSALANGRLRMAYQPVGDLRQHTIVSVEALLRWSDPRYGEIPPSEFIPLAEESDLINQIGAYTLTTTIREMTAWRAKWGKDMGLAVNLSARQLDDPDLVATVDGELGSTGLPAHRLCLEITESVLMRDPAAAHRKLNLLRDIGVRLAIDDFGTGYSSLAQIRRLPVDTLKIDQSFISGLEDSRDARVIVTSIIAMAHAVDLRVIAEGVENARQLDILGELGCDQVQGYYLGRPVPVDELRG